MNDGFSSGSRIPDQAVDVLPHRRRWVYVTVIVVLLLVAGAALAWYVMGLEEDPDPTPTGEAPSAALEPFYTQSLDWSDCGTARCTRVEVPVDYDDPEGETLELAVRMYRAQGESSEGSIFVNPGGPGGSAVDFAGSMANEFGQGVIEKYDVVGVDPRGVGDSTPLECFDDSAMDAFVSSDPDPDDAGEVEAFRNLATDMARACESNSGELASHVSTEEVARDMDVVRGLLGRDKMDWFGASYGTQLGATYAHLFPDRVRHMVLDGAVDSTVGPFGGALGQATGFQRAFDAYAADCIKKDDCPLGGSVDEARAQVAGLFEQLDAEPMQTSSGRELTEGHAFYGVAVPLYSQETWDYLTQALTGALENNDGTMLLLLSDAYFSRDLDGGYSNNIGQVIYAVNCLDASERPTQEEVEQQLPEFVKESPVFGRALGWGVLSCTDWPLTSDTPQGEVSAEGAEPIIVIGTTRDPATPYEWAGSLADQLESGVLVSRDGDGHTAYASGNQCIDDIVDSYFVDGTVPKDETRCEAE